MLFSKMNIVKLPSRHWQQLEKIFDEEFDSDLPPAENAEIFIANENGERLGFILKEKTEMVGLIYVYPETKKDIAKTALSLVRFIKSRAAKGTSICCVASEPRFGRLFKSLGMEKIPGDLYRINL